MKLCNLIKYKYNSIKQRGCSLVDVLWSSRIYLLSPVKLPLTDVKWPLLKENGYKSSVGDPGRTDAENG